MAELFWSVFNLEMKDLPEIVAFVLEYLFPGLEFILLHVNAREIIKIFKKLFIAFHKSENPLFDFVKSLSSHSPKT